METVAFLIFKEFIVVHFAHPVLSRFKIPLISFFCPFTSLKYELSLLYGLFFIFFLHFRIREA